MPDSSEQDDQAPQQSTEGDYEYDEAHEVRRGQEHLPHAHPAVSVVTETSDDDQDLSYDLAHDIPAPRRD